MNNFLTWEQERDFLLSSIRQNRFNLSTGIVELSFPMPMTTDDVQDFKDAMAVTFRILERTATNGQRQEGEITTDILQQTPGA